MAQCGRFYWQRRAKQAPSGRALAGWPRSAVQKWFDPVSDRSKVSTDSVDNSLDNLFNQAFRPEMPSKSANWLIFNQPFKIY
jgi:hypothetical protein